MGHFNEDLVKAAVMLAGEGLQPSSKGARVRFSGTKRTVIDGPFAETKELIAGFWIWKVKSREEAIDLGQALSQPVPGRIGDRDSASVRGRRLRRRIHARAARAGKSACARKWPRRSRRARLTTERRRPSHRRCGPAMGARRASRAESRAPSQPDVRSVYADCSDRTLRWTPRRPIYGGD